MSQQWIREISATVGGTDFSSLRIRFKVEQNNRQRPNALSLIITNPEPGKAKSLIKEKAPVELAAGYQGSVGGIFKGTSIQVRYGRETPTETYLGVVATGGDQAYNFAVASKTLASGHTFRDQVDHILEKFKPFGITEGYISDLGNKKMPRAKTLFGMGRDVLRTIAQSTKADWWIDDNKLYIVKSTDTVPGQAVVLSSSTGLIGMPEQTPDGIIGKCLLNSKIKPGTRLKIDQKSIQQAAFSPDYTAEKNNEMLPSLAEDGFYKVIVVAHEGDTHGATWYSTFNCIRADGQGGSADIRAASQGYVIPD